LAQLQGTWANDDSATQSVTRVLLDATGTGHVTAFGRCHPTECDWGVRTPSVTGNAAEATFVFANGAPTKILSLRQPASQVGLAVAVGSQPFEAFHRSEVCDISPLPDDDGVPTQSRSAPSQISFDPQ
jgi:hypothetical protein